MLKLFKYMKPYFWQCLVLVLAVGLQVFGTLMLPTMMADIVNNGINNNVFGHCSVGAWHFGVVLFFD